jgi:hypothetical protein
MDGEHDCFIEVIGKRHLKAENKDNPAVTRMIPIEILANHY